MEVSEQQKGLLEAMRTIAQHEAQRNSGPQFQTGVVVEDPAGYKCIVRVNDTEKTCTLQYIYIRQGLAQRNSGPQFQTGVVVEEPAGYKSIVRVNGTEKTWTLQFIYIRQGLAQRNSGPQF